MTIRAYLHALLKDRALKDTVLMISWRRSIRVPNTRLACPVWRRIMETSPYSHGISGVYIYLTSESTCPSCDTALLIDI